MKRCRGRGVKAEMMMIIKDINETTILCVRGDPAGDQPQPSGRALHYRSQQHLVFPFTYWREKRSQFNLVL